MIIENFSNSRINYDMKTYVNFPDHHARPNKVRPSRPFFIWLVRFEPPNVILRSKIFGGSVERAHKKRCSHIFFAASGKGFSRYPSTPAKRLFNRERCPILDISLFGRRVLRLRKVWKSSDPFLHIFQNKVLTLHKYRFILRSIN